MAGTSGLQAPAGAAWSGPVTIRNVAAGSVSHRQGRRRFLRRALARSKALLRHQMPGGGSSRRHSLTHAPAGSASAVRTAAPDLRRAPVAGSKELRPPGLLWRGGMSTGGARRALWRKRPVFTGRTSLTDRGIIRRVLDLEAVGDLLELDLELAASRGRYLGCDQERRNG